MESQIENTFIDLKIALPNKKSECEKCIARLTTLLNQDKQFNKVHISQKKGQTGLCLHYQPDMISLNQVKALVKTIGAKVTNNFKHRSFHIKGMSSADCAKTIEHFLANTDGVLNARASYASETLRLEYDGEKVLVPQLIKQLSHLGFDISEKDKPKTWWQKNHEFVYSIGSGVLLLLSWCLNHHPQIALGLAIAAFFIAGSHTLKHSIHTLLSKRFDIDVLMVIAAIGAACLGAWQEGALLLVLFALGHALEHRALNRAQRAIKSLSKMSPTEALVIRHDAEELVDIDDLELGEVVIVKPSQRIPVDGTIESGSSSVNQASITGESMPVNKNAGDSVYAGTVNEEGLITVKVTALAKDTLLARMVQMVLEAETQKSPTQRFTDSFVKIFVPTILIGVLLLIFVPPLFGHAWSDSFYRAMAVLVAASPCALAIATPAAILSGVARAAQHGILIKGGMHLENLGQVDVIAFDKTGTLTKGEPQVRKIIALNEFTNDEVLTLAASLEINSTHPLAKAIVKEAEKERLSLRPIDNMKSIAGKGIAGELDGQRLAVGSLKLFSDVTDEIKSAADGLFNEGYSVMVVRLDKIWVGLIAVSDTLRDETKASLNELLHLGIKKTIMLTGDNERTAKSIAKEVHITDVKANLLPEDKLKVITELSKEHTVAMLGDGVNDAPAMAKACVGIAMGGAGTDVALEAADCALMADDLSKLPFAIKLSRKARGIIKQNLFGALTVVALLLLATATGYAGIGLAVVIHEGSTLVVVLNALRLLKF